MVTNKPSMPTLRTSRLARNVAAGAVVAAGAAAAMQGANAGPVASAASRSLARSTPSNGSSSAAPHHAEFSVPSSGQFARKKQCRDNQKIAANSGACPDKYVRSSRFDMCCDDVSTPEKKAARSKLNQKVLGGVFGGLALTSVAIGACVWGPDMHTNYKKNQADKKAEAERKQKEAAEKARSNSAASSSASITRPPAAAQPNRSNSSVSGSASGAKKTDGKK
jgi:hypothetical protein